MHMVGPFFFLVLYSAAGLRFGAMPQQTVRYNASTVPLHADRDKAEQ